MIKLKVILIQIHSYMLYLYDKVNFKNILRINYKYFKYFSTHNPHNFEF